MSGLTEQELKELKRLVREEHQQRERQRWMSHVWPTPRTGYLHWSLAAGLVFAALVVIAFVAWQLGSVYLS